MTFPTAKPAETQPVNMTLRKAIASMIADGAWHNVASESFIANIMQLTGKDPAHTGWFYLTVCRIGFEVARLQDDGVIITDDTDDAHWIRSAMGSAEVDTYAAQ